MAMRDSTPYRERPLTERAHEERCMGKLLQHAADVDFIWEAFGGVGDVAAQLTQRFPYTCVVACDLDQHCVDMYNQRMIVDGRSALCTCRDASLGPPTPTHSVWAASLDFNRFTVMDLETARAPWKRRLVTQVLSYDPAPTWVHLTDSACRYLHLNWRRYGCADARLDTYVRRMDRLLRSLFGWRVTHHVGYHGATYMLLGRA